MNICFVALQSYPLLRCPDHTTVIGGAELQQKYLGDELQRQGHHVSYLVYDHGQAATEEINGIRIRKTFDPRQGLPGIRFWYPRLPGLWRALQRTDADIYYCRCTGWHLGVVAYFAARYRKICVYAAANESDFYPPKNLRLAPWYRWLYIYGLQKARLIICQTRPQTVLLWHHYRRRGPVIPNTSPPCPTINNRRGEWFLWVSKIRSFKRPAWLLALARQLPQCRFVMIGGPSASEPQLYQEIQSQARQLDNLTFLGAQPFSQVESYLSQARALVNTSLYEGFPNTYLQAWRRGVPVVTTFDPALEINARSLGYVAADIQQLANYVAGLHRGDLHCDPHHIRREYQQTYHPAVVVKQLVQTLTNLRAARTTDPYNHSPGPATSTMRTRSCNQHNEDSVLQPAQ